MPATTMRRTAHLDLGEPYGALPFRRAGALMSTASSHRMAHPRPDEQVR